MTFRASEKHTISWLVSSNGIRLASSSEVRASKQQLLPWASKMQWIAVISWATKQQLHFGLASRNALFEPVTINNSLGYKTLITP